MINDRNRATALRSQAVFTRQMIVLERKMGVDVEKILQKECSSVISSLNAGTKPNVDAAVKAHSFELKKALIKWNMRTGTLFGKNAFNEMEGLKNSSKKYALNALMGDSSDFSERSNINPLSLKASSTESIYLEQLHQKVTKLGAEKVKEIDESTKTKLKRIIDRGMEAEKALPDIANQISKWVEETVPNRAMTIARTETHSAAVSAFQDAVQIQGDELGMESVKSWASSNDDRTRETHRKADYTTNEKNKDIQMDKPFIVGGEELQFPGDPAGSPENVINCRCVVLYNTKVKEGNPAGEKPTETEKPTEQIPTATLVEFSEQDISTLLQSVENSYQNPKELPAISPINRFHNTILENSKNYESDDLKWLGHYRESCGINKQLRNNRVDGNDFYMKQRDALDNLVKKSSPFKDNFITFRGETFDDFETWKKARASLKVGDKLDAVQYISTSINKSTGEDFEQQYTNAYTVLFKFNVPKGSKAITMNSLDIVKKKSEDVWSEQFEVIFGRNTKAKILKITTDETKKKLYIDAEIIKETTFKNNPNQIIFKKFEIKKTKKRISAINSESFGSFKINGKLWSDIIKEKE